MSKIPRLAIFDPEAFYPFRSLVKGPLYDPSDLQAIERFVRAIVLHDEMRMEPAPSPYPKEGVPKGGITLIASFAPGIGEYGLFLEQTSYRSAPVPDVELSESLLDSLSKSLHAGPPGNPYYQLHIEYLKRLASALEQGGSIICDGPVAAGVLEEAQKFPMKLFENLDQDWQEYAHKADVGDLGLIVPPVLAIVLTRCAKRAAIPTVLRDLRDEWASARSKVWELIDGLKSSRTIGEANDISRQLADASRYFSPAEEGYETPPVRVLWDLITGAVAGAGIAGLAGGSIKTGALTGLVNQAAGTARSMLEQGDFARVLFGRGAFDLARRIRTETMKIEPNTLARLLTDSERRSLSQPGIKHVKVIYGIT